MVRLFLLALVLPIALASVAAQIFGGPAALALLSGSALGAVQALAWHRSLTARRVRELAEATRALVGSDSASPPGAARFGHLAPVAEAVEYLGRALRTVKEEATNDKLTKVASRHTFLSALFQEVERATRYGRPLTVAFIDIDHFKMVNDTHGHEAGDEVLRAVAGLFREHTRENDLVGRYGGEEFVILFPETSIDEATAVAEKLRLLVAKQTVGAASGESVRVSISIGLAGGHGQMLRVEDLLRDADAAMYAAKSLGRNQTYVFAELDDDSLRIPRAPISAVGRARAEEVGDTARRAAEDALTAIVGPLPGHRGKPSSLIAMIAVRLARQLELPEPEVDRIRMAALLHDIGKLGIPEEILEKPGPLSSEEWHVVVQHPRIGQEILNRVAAIKDAAAIILHHHERFSGHGYPYGLRGAEIPLGARIVAIADAYDAMICDRPYRAAVTHDDALREIRAHAGTQFDPEIVALFCALYETVPPLLETPIFVTPMTPAHVDTGVVPHRRRRRRRDETTSREVASA